MTVLRALAPSRRGWSPHHPARPVHHARATAGRCREGRAQGSVYGIGILTQVPAVTGALQPVALGRMEDHLGPALPRRPPGAAPRRRPGLPCNAMAGGGSV
jgi:hypothetical protein